jgi:hypothetical protein
LRPRLTTGLPLATPILSAWTAAFWMVFRVGMDAYPTRIGRHASHRGGSTARTQRSFDRVAALRAGRRLAVVVDARAAGAESDGAHAAHLDQRCSGRAISARVAIEMAQHLAEVSTASRR